MRINNLEQFIKLRRELTEEKEQLSRRLAQINEALGDIPLPSLPIAQGAATPSAPAAAPARAGRKPAGGGTSLRQLVIDVLKGGPLTKEEVLAAVKKLGYKFQTNNPLNSLGVILYGKNPKLKRVEGRFSLGGAASSASSVSPSPAGAGGKRQMSAAARARIAEAQRKRWAATRKPAAAAASAPKAGSGKRQISAAGRKAIAEAARKRWAAVRAAGKNKL